LLLHKTPNQAKFCGDQLKNAGDIRDRKFVLPEKVDQSSPKIFRGCYPLRPPIMPNFIEIGPTSLEIGVVRKKIISTHTYIHTDTRHPDYLSRASQHARGANKNSGCVKATMASNVARVTLLRSCLQAQALASQAEKRQRSFDKVVDEWKRKVADLQAELERSQRDSRAHAAEVYKLRSQLEESNDSAEGLRRENKNLTGQSAIRSSGTRQRDIISNFYGEL